MENLNQNPHRRYNILTDEWVLVSPHRTKRPWQGKEEQVVKNERPDYDPECYLCPGNTRASGKQNPDYNSPWSFVNDFAALKEDTKVESQENGLLLAKTEPGVCKVVCFSPNHALTLPLMPVDDIKKVIALWQKEYRELGSKKKINYVQIFENKGQAMGCSNPHPHGQIWSQHSIPTEVLKKSDSQINYWKKHNTSLLKDYLNQELELKERILINNTHFVALIPYWAVWPYEAMIIPKKQHHDITTLNDDEQKDFAKTIKELTIMYDNLFNTSFPYSSGIHQAPTDGNTHTSWHFHMSFYPPLLRSATVKKFMVGYEMFAMPQRDITAEQAATTLRNLPKKHFSIR